ncbi:xanthine dehydrogenase small subunit [Ideonella sp.]|uniref:xanthine dehydrogenase small subunit n=1 Tax=Ideonella sp. TaxID=1929293 RepID=UPI002B494926|nr:xanthine dehydrogenase small subunit [Ideonella sp.]HJV70556.1 xanthine dehydrogenase small subunit [Ideonella sp.]
MSKPPIRFVFRGQLAEASAEEPTRSVLQWLREDTRACGSKEGCAEGDCGACAVIVAELDEDVPPPTRALRLAGLALRPVNACIRFLPTLHGKALLTIEDLAAPDGTLHPAQRALVDHHGSQCGFCTPGFAVSLALCHERHAEAGTRPTRGELADELAGNLCRCTGYRPILDAGEAMGGTPGPRLALEGMADQLRALRAEQAPLSVPGFEAPRTLAALASARAARPGATLLAGATDIGLWVNKQFKPLPDLIYLGDVAELRRITESASILRIGAAVTLEDGWAALVARWPALAEMARRFAGPPVRHAGTLVGNLANGSPIGDTAPVLIALGASLTLRRGDATRDMPLQDFYLDYMKNQLAPGEFVEAVAVPLTTTTDPGWHVQAHKLSKRFDCDISAVSAGFALRLEGERIAEARLAFGGMAAIVKRAAGAEAALVGQAWTEATLRAAQHALASDFAPLTDLRASAAYRGQAAAALLERLWWSTRPVDPLPEAALRVFA